MQIEKEIVYNFYPKCLFLPCFFCECLFPRPGGGGGGGGLLARIFTIALKIGGWTINVSTLGDYLLRNKRITSVYRVKRTSSHSCNHKEYSLQRGQLGGAGRPGGNE